MSGFCVSHPPFSTSRWVPQGAALACLCSWLGTQTKAPLSEESALPWRTKAHRACQLNVLFKAALDRAIITLWWLTAEPGILAGGKCKLNPKVPRVLEGSSHARALSDSTLGVSSLCLGCMARH